MTITWGQYYNGFTEEDIDKAKYNVIKITEKMLELHEKINDENKDKIKEVIDRLHMSRTCIEYYYSL
jgi:hypothetical protein|tara:strand:+ start:162 stop:362 length:201 start_codon:yes stop_codon:yes gene_type:complete